MIKVLEKSNDEQMGPVDKYVVQMVADTKEEVNAIGTDGSTVVGLKKDDIISFGSTCITTSGDFGILKSNGSWNWI